MAGMHPADIAVLVVYLLGITALGAWMGRRVQSSSDFFMPRKFGKTMMIMPAFGTGTASDQAVTVAAATPGPSFFALIAGEITLLILAVLGLVALAARMGELFFAIRLLGAANLFYLEWKLWRMPLGETSPNCGYVKARFGDRP